MTMSPAGTEPVKFISTMRRLRKFVKRDISDGIVPSILFLSSHKPNNVVAGNPISVGIVPLNRLLVNEMNCSGLRKNALGIVP